MTAKAAASRREASREIHSALDSLLPRLKFEEVGRLAADLTRLAARPQLPERAFLSRLSTNRPATRKRTGG